MTMRLITGFVLVIVIAVVAWLWLVQTSSEPEPEPLPEPAMLQAPEEYWAEGEGHIALDNNKVPGRVRLDYLVNPDQTVVIQNLVVWMGDLDLVVPFLWWEAAREPLRCTVFRNPEAIQGVLENGELVIPAGTRVLGQSYFERSPDGGCKGEARRLEPVSNAELRITHDPEADQFGFSAEFADSHDGNDLTISLQLQGRYLNRPPVAELLVTGEDVSTAADGCPVTEKGKPPIALANTPKGLLVTLRSESHDPDGHWPPDAKPKRSRVDLNFEQWARSRPGGFSFLGAGRELGPVLFEVNREHQLLLWVTDRRGAESRKLCHFQVIPPA